MDDPRASLRLDSSAGGKLLDEALAKRAENGSQALSYREHVTDVYVAWCGLVDLHQPMIARIAVRCDTTPDRLLQSSLLCVALHDVGKLSTNFQRMMHAVDEKAYRTAVRLNYRHEVAALWLVERMAQAIGEKYGPMPGNGLLEVLAVAGHHKYLADGYLFDEELFSQMLDWRPDAWTAAVAACGLANAMFKDQGWRLPQTIPGVTRKTVNKFLRNYEVNDPFDCLMRAKDQIALMASDKDAQHFREIFVIVKGLLMAADWMASGAAIEPEMLDARQGVMQVPSSALQEFMKSKIERDRQQRAHLPPFAGFKRFQTRCAKATGHVLAVAPTGSGKTEAALLWALNQAETRGARKLFFLLPTMVTANSLHARISDFFEQHGHSVGLVHSTADLVRGDHRGNNNDQPEADRGDVRAKLLRTTHFFLPVTVGSVDQLLVTLFQSGRWPLKTFSAADAAIIIDEVHAYDAHSAGLVVLLINQLRNLGARFMVMSATMPVDLRNTLLDALESGANVDDPKNVVVVQDDELLSQARNIWEVCPTALTRWLSRGDEPSKLVPSATIRELLKEINDRGEPIRILIVMNTVKRCQEVARLLQEYKPVCYHSKFIFQDRCEKERQINHCQPRLIVASQVVEVSLDIDYDILLTECAPLDALAQRAGRVNRARRPIKGRVIVFPFEESSEKIYDEPTGVLAKSWSLCQENQGELTERDLSELVEAAYAGHTLSQDNAFQTIQAETRATQRRLYGVLDNPQPDEDEHLVTRLEKYHQISVIPESFADEVRRRPAWERRLFELKMPVWYFREHKCPDRDGLPICEMGYDATLGAQLLVTSKEIDPACCVI